MGTVWIDRESVDIAEVLEEMGFVISSAEAAESWSAVSR